MRKGALKQCSAAGHFEASNRQRDVGLCSQRFGIRKLSHEPAATGRILASGLAATGAALAADTHCTAGTLYLTLDTGNMRHAEAIAEILKKHQVKATFFVAQEKTLRGDMALDPSWADFWKARVAEGHAFGSHTYDHVYWRADRADGRGGQAVIARAQSAPVKDRLKQQTERARSLGIFGAPSFTVGTELFWGDDRLDDALAWCTAQ